MAELKRMSIKVSEDLYNYIQEDAKKRGLTMNAVVVFALENYVRESSVMPTLRNVQLLMEALEKEKEERLKGQ